MLKKYLGKTICGYCNGYFGRDDYDTKKIVFVGKRYIVTENSEGWGNIAYFTKESKKEAEELIELWLDEDEEDDW
ncbi:hypothetical protein [Terrisporobacter sp.]|uniref:hypothetical protein n=1 Tax=Terrisporobacter sp. TaxID=1965305 RepID=UPI00289D5C64|nr:hypothetical protein [Terrisporobacter sp.]